MTKQAQVAMRVRHVATSLQFYMDVLAFPLADEQPVGDMALLVDSDGDPLLLAGPAAVDLQPYLHEEHFMMSLESKNRPLLFLWKNQGDLQQSLRDHDIIYTLKEERTGEIIVMLQDPNGYKLHFMLPNQRTLGEQVEHYEQCIVDLECALEGLTESDMDLRLESTSWSVRQIVHHLAYNELLFVPPLHMALNRPGLKYLANWGDNEQMNGTIFRKLPVASAVNYMRATHAYMVEMLNCGLDFTNHTVLLRERPWSVKQILSAFLRHLYEHLSEIMAIRQKYGK